MFGEVQGSNFKKKGGRWEAWHMFTFGDMIYIHFGCVSHDGVGPERFSDMPTRSTHTRIADLTH